MEREIINFGTSSLRLNLKTLSTDTGHEYRGAHIHNEIELVKMEEGSLVCHFEKEQQTISKGELLFINRHVIHNLSTNDPTARLSYLQIDMDSYIGHINPYFEEYPFIFAYNKRLPYRAYDKTSELWQIFENIEQELKNRGHCYEEYLRADIYRIAAFMFRYSFLTKDTNNIKDIKKILPAIRYSEENYMSDISLEILSQLTNIDKFYFCKLFKQIIGITYTEYLNHLRLSRAEELLIKTDMNISEIALECGFNSNQYFNRIFRKEKNCTPRQFKKMMEP